MRGSTHAGQMDMTTQDGPPRARGDRPVVSQPGGATFKATPARAGINRTEMAYNEKPRGRAPRTRGSTRVGNGLGRSDPGHPSHAEINL